LDQRLFETAGGLGMGDDFGRVFRQARSRRVQPLKPCHRRWWWGDDQRLFRPRQVAANQCFPDNRRILHGQRHGRK
jgi:hypothetical protein